MSTDFCHPLIAELGSTIDFACVHASARFMPALRGRPGRLSSDADFSEAVRQAASQLPYEQAQALWLVDVCGSGYDDGATETKTSREEFAQRLHRARSTIRRELAAQLRQ